MDQHIGHVFKSLRREKSWSQADLAAKLGVKQPYIHDIEKGNRTPSPDLLRSLAVLAGLEPRTLMWELPPDRHERTLSEITLPLYGLVNAGPVCEAADGVPEMVDVRSVIPRECFLLRVNGDSVSGLGVFSGDLIAVLPNQTPHDGDLVVALIDGGYTLKAYRDGKLWECRNGMPSKSFDLKGAESVTVKGVVVQILGARRFPPPKLPRR